MSYTTSTTKNMAGFKPIGPIALNWVSHWHYLLSAVDVHATTHFMFYREQFVTAPPTTGPKK